MDRPRALELMDESFDHYKAAMEAPQNTFEERLELDRALLKSNWAIFNQLRELTIAVAESAAQKRDDSE